MLLGVPESISTPLNCPAQKFPLSVSIIWGLSQRTGIRNNLNLQNQMSLSRLRTTSKSAPATQIDIAIGKH